MATRDVFAMVMDLRTQLTDLATHASNVRAQVATEVQEIGRGVTDATRHAATALDDFIFLLQQKVEQGDDLAQSVLDIIAQVEAGTLRADQAAQAFIDITTTLTGETRNLGALLQDLLGQAQVTQQNLLTGIQAARDWKGALEALREIHSQAAQNVVKIFEAFQQGKVTLEFMLKVLQEIKQKVKPGDAVGELADILANAGRTGDF